MGECLRVARYSGKALVDSSRDVVGDPRRVVGLLADVERVVIWFSKGLKFPGVQVHGDIQEIHHLQVRFDGNFEVEALEDFRQLFSEAVCGLWAGVLEGGQSIVSVEADSGSIDEA